MSRTAQQFLTAVHRRRVFAALSDAGAMALGSGAVAAAALCFVPSIAIVAFATIFAAIFVWRWFKRIDRFQTAADLDRALNSHDLLATAIFLTPVSDADFARQVTAAADARFGSVDPAAFTGNRVGVRGWSLSGIAVLAAAVLVFRFPGKNLRPADAPPSTLLADLVRTAADRSSMQQAGPSGPHSTRPIDEPDASKFGQTETTADSVGDPKQLGDDHRQNSQSAGSAGGGPGQSQTHTTTEKLAGSTGNSVAAGGTEAGDGRSPGTGGPAAPRAGGGAAALPSSSDPWQSSNWSAVQQTAATAVANGAVPVRARQLVHDYFDGD